MRLHLPSLLLTAILATFPSFTASAAVVGTGVSYDNGKGSAPYSADERAHSMGTYTEGEHVGQLRSDTVLCWANSAANMIQFWQDAYGEYLTTAAPNGFNDTKYTSPQGTRYLNVYEKILYASTQDEGGYQNEALNWYFNQEGGSEYLAQKEEAYIKGAAPTVGSDYFIGEYAVSRLKDELTAAFSKAGQSVGLQIWQQDYGPDTSNWRYHAITCWGFETDSDGNINALYLTDSDDMEFGVFKVHVSEGETLPQPPTPDLPYPGDSYPAIVLSTDDNIDGYNSSFVVSLIGTYRLITPDGYTPSDGCDLPVPSLPSTTDAAEVYELTSNTIVDGKVKRTGAGIKVGKGEQGGAPDIVMLVSESWDSDLSGLTLAGNQSGTGLDVKLGSLASVANLSVSGYERGVNAEGKVYLFGESVNVSGNTLSNGDGAGIHNTNYVEIKDATEVNITENSATSGRGGGIYNEDVVSITNNGMVIFSENKAASGNDIYNAKGGRVNIADNGGVKFVGERGVGSVAIVNNGELYLKSGTYEDGWPTSISFSDASLDSRGGTTYVGQDIKGETAVTSLYFLDAKEELPLSMELSSKASSPAAMLDHLKVNAEGIIGVDAGISAIKNADVYVSNDLKVSRLTLDSSSTFTGYDTNLTLDNLVIDLSGFTMTPVGETFEFDISGMFADFAGMTINNVYLDASSLNLYDGWDEQSFVSVNFGSALQSLDDGTRLAVLIGNDMMTQSYNLKEGGNVEFRGMVVVPEPATGTLSLLALAGLAARRRRK